MSEILDVLFGRFDKRRSLPLIAVVVVYMLYSVCLFVTA